MLLRWACVNTCFKVQAGLLKAPRRIPRFACQGESSATTNRIEDIVPWEACAPNALFSVSSSQLCSMVFLTHLTFRLIAGRCAQRREYTQVLSSQSDPDAVQTRPQRVRHSYSLVPICQPGTWTSRALEVLLCSYLTLVSDETRFDLTRSS